jgi:hypothetical protein
MAMTISGRRTTLGGTQPARLRDAFGLSLTEAARGLDRLNYERGRWYARSLSR